MNSILRIFPQQISVRRVLLVILLGCAATVCLKIIRPVHAGTTFTVTSTSDASNGACNPANVGNGCTLRDAIIAANLNPGADTINFSVSGTITLSSDLPQILDTLTIDGAGQNIILDGAHQRTVLFALKDLTLNQVTIANGTSDSCDGQYCDGGAIWSFESNVTVSNCTFSNNSASRFGGAIAATGGKVVITGSTFSSNSAGAVAGAICAGTCATTNFIAGGDLTLINSAFSNNTAADSGGAIDIDGHLDVSNCTFSGNSAQKSGGAIDSASLTNGNVSVNNSSFSGNSADTGAGISSFVPVTITNSTFSGNQATSSGGAIFEIAGALNISNSSFVNNSAGSFASLPENS
jgi:CSLREA domain-containing protein